MVEGMCASSIICNLFHIYSISSFVYALLTTMLCTLSFLSDV